MGILDSLFGGGKKNNPMEEANKYLSQIPGVGHQYYDPFINQGQAAGQKAQSQYDMLLADPVGFINKLMEGYKPSEGYKFANEELTRGMGNTAAAGGIAGTPLDQMNQAKGTQGLLSKDMQQFLQNVLGRYDIGLGGEQGIANQGFQASGSLADLLGGALNQQGGLAFQNAQNQNSNRNDIFGTLGKALGVGAGALFGGLPGAVAGGKIGSSIFG
jgi:hypothetical protein